MKQKTKVILFLIKFWLYSDLKQNFLICFPLSILVFYLNQNQTIFYENAILLVWPIELDCVSVTC